ncbi:MAG: PH domain-containing protein [Afipia sp.]|nr:PH domain-containing protein [Afipia sp.]OJW63743.1 MAG: hypothetical protein BGO65_09115 [Afipia sp. 64-13]
MGRYVDEILQPGEKVRYSTTIHGIVYLPGLSCWLGSVICLIAAQGAPGGWGLALLVASAALALVGGILVFQAWFRRWTTETDVTSMRVIHKQGFIRRRTFEMNLDRVESVDVDQSILGRIFGWGDITIRGVGEGVERLRMIRSPLQFRNHITAH